MSSLTLNPVDEGKHSLLSASCMHHSLTASPSLRRASKRVVSVTLAPGAVSGLAISIASWGGARSHCLGSRMRVFCRSILGYKKDVDGGLVVDESQAPTVRLIHQLFIDGHSISNISQELTRRGLKTVKGKTTGRPARSARSCPTRNTKATCCRKKLHHQLPDQTSTSKHQRDSPVLAQG